MVRLTHTRAEWVAIAHELEAPHGVAAPPGLADRLRALLREAPADWPDQEYALELDAGSADAVRAAHASLTGSGDAAERQRAASVAEAEAIVRDHQRRG